MAAGRFMVPPLRSVRVWPVEGSAVRLAVALATLTSSHHKSRRHATVDGGHCERATHEKSAHVQ
jgi:hypothetical protein